jgi:hypothetical protein
MTTQGGEPSSNGGPARAGLEDVIAALAMRLRVARELGGVSAYFHDVVVAHPALMPSSNPGVHDALGPMLIMMLEKKLGARVTGKTVTLHLPSARFWHGHIVCKRGMAVFFYFDDMGMGLLSYARSLDDPNVAYARFSASAVSGTNAFPMLGAPRKA